MPTLNEKLAASLEKLQKLQSDGRHVFQSSELPRLDRERLLAQGFVREVIKGWLISASPDTAPGDTTPWFASFWEFCARYCDVRFGKNWHLSAEQSLLLHAENTVIPNQVVVYSPEGTNNTVSLLFGTSTYDLKSKMPAKTDVMVKDGLQLFTTVSALVKVPEDFIGAIRLKCRWCSRVSRRLLADPCCFAGRRPYCRRRTSGWSLYPHRWRTTSPTKSSRP